MVDSFRYKKRAIIRHYVFRLPIMPHRLSHWFKEWFNPYKRYQHQRAMHAIRLALAVVSAILIAYLGNIEHGEWIAMTVFVLLGSVPYQGAINSKAYERIIGTLLGMAIGIALIWLNHHLLHNSPLYFIAIAVISAVSGWHTLGNYGYAAMLAGLTMAMLLGNVSDNWLHAGIIRAVNVIIGVFIVLIASALIPIKSMLTWRFLLSDNLATCAHQFSLITVHKALPQDTQNALWLEQRSLNARLVKSRSLLAPTAHESKINLALLDSIQQSQRNIVSSINLMLATVPKLPKARLSIEDEQLLSRHFATLQHDLHRASKLLKGEWRQPISIHFPEEAQVRAIAAKLPFETQGFVWTSLNIRNELANLLALLQSQREKWLTAAEKAKLGAG